MELTIFEIFGTTPTKTTTKSFLSQWLKIHISKGNVGVAYNLTINVDVRENEKEWNWRKKFISIDVGIVCGRELFNFGWLETRQHRHVHDEIGNFSVKIIFLLAFMWCVVLWRCVFEWNNRIVHKMQMKT